MKDENKKEVEDFLKRFSGPGVVRKTSLEKMDECPIWNGFLGLWEESDAQLRARIKALRGGKDENN